MEALTLEAHVCGFARSGNPSKNYNITTTTTRTRTTTTTTTTTNNNNNKKEGSMFCTNNTTDDLFEKYILIKRVLPRPMFLWAENVKFNTLNYP